MIKTEERRMPNNNDYNKKDNDDNVNDSRSDRNVDQFLDRKENEISKKKEKKKKEKKEKKQKRKSPITMTMTSTEDKETTDGFLSNPEDITPPSPTTTITITTNEPVSVREEACPSEFLSKDTTTTTTTTNNNNNNDDDDEEWAKQREKVEFQIDQFWLSQFQQSPPSYHRRQGVVIYREIDEEEEEETFDEEEDYCSLCSDVVPLTMTDDDAIDEISFTKELIGYDF